MAVGEFYMPELDEEYFEDTFFKLTELTAIIKSAIADVLGDQKFIQSKIFDYTNELLEAVVSAVVAIGKPFKYIVTCTVAGKGCGIGTHTGHRCNWDLKNDNFITIRWENKTISTVITVYGSGLFTVAGWPKDVSKPLCKFTSRRYELKHLKEKAAHAAIWAEYRRAQAAKFRPSIYQEILRNRALMLKRSRRFRDSDLGANKYNCVDEDDVVVFEDVEETVREFCEIIWNPDYYQQQEDIKAAAKAREDAELAAILAEEEEEEEMEAALEAERNKRVFSVQF